MSLTTTPFVLPILGALVGALGVLLVWVALTTPPRVRVSSALDLEARERKTLLDQLDDRFERAGLHVSSREVLSSGLLIGGVAGLVTLVVTGQIAFSVFVAVLGPAAIYLRAESRRDQAERDYQEGLVDALDILRSAYAVTPDIRGAIAEAAQHAPESVRGDLQAASAMLLQGSSVEEAFAPAQARRRNMFLDMVVEALALREQEGGNVGEVLSNIQDLIREQGRIFQRTMARQTQARLEAMIVCLSPVVFFVFVRTLFRDYEQGFYNTITGQLVLVAALLIDGVAYLLTRKISRMGLEIVRVQAK